MSDLLLPEVLPPEPMVRAVCCRKPLGQAREVLELPAGGTVAEMLAAAGYAPDLLPWLHVQLDGEPVPRASWGLVRPQPKQILVAAVVPQGGDGGKNVLRVVAMIAVMVIAVVTQQYYLAAYGATLTTAAGVTTYTTGSLLASYAIGAAITVGGMLAVNALIPPPLARFDAGREASRAYSLSGSRNEARPYGAVPRVYGRHRVYPCLAALPYTEIVGKDQYLRVVLTPGYGPLDIENIRIGETPLGQFEDVEYEVRQGYPDDEPLTLYTRDVHEETLAVELPDDHSRQTRRTQPDIDQISVDVGFPGGLLFVDKDGHHHTWDVGLEIQYRAVGGSTWMTAAAPTYSDNRAGLVRRGYRWTVPLGQYDVCLIKTFSRRMDVWGSGSHPPHYRTPDSVKPPEVLLDDLYWTALRSIRRTQPVTMPGLALIALRIRATDQLSGSLDQVNCIVTSILDTWNGSSWVKLATRNPAWAYIDCRRGSANKRPAPDSRFDLAGLREWAQDNNAKDRYCDIIFDSAVTVSEAARTIAATGRAADGRKDYKYSVVRDVPQSAPTQVWTPRTSRNFTVSRTFIDLPHGLKVRFINEEKGWVRDELIVYADGYKAANATKFEAIDLVGITSPAQVWKEGRYHLAVLIHRPKTYGLEIDFESLAATRGDLAGINHDVPMWGLGSGRIKVVTKDGGNNVTSITVDEPFTMAAGTAYTVRLRLADGEQYDRQVTTVAGEQTSLTFVVPIPPTENQPEVRDLVLYGEVGQAYVELLVRGIERLTDFGAKLLLVDAAPAVHLADQGPIPPYESQITVPPELNRPAPPKPIVEGVRSDELVLIPSADGRLVSRIVVSLGRQSNAEVAAEYLQVQFKTSASDAQAAWDSLPVQPPDAVEVSITPVEDGVAYDIRLRSVSGPPAPGLASEWTYIRNHTVIGKSALPPDVGTAALEGLVLRWLYPEPPLDVQHGGGFLVRHHPGNYSHWETGIPAHEGVLTVTWFDVSAVPGGTRTFMIKAVDCAGNESLGAAVVVKDLGDLDTANVVVETDHKALGWPGVKADCAVSGGNLLADDLSGPLFTNDADPLFTADADPLFTNIYAEMRYTATLTAAAASRLLVELTAAGASWYLEYQPEAGADELEPLFTNDADPLFTNDADPLFTVTLAGYLPWPGFIDLAASQQVRIRLTILGGSTRGTASALKLIEDVADVIEHFHNVNIAAAGTRLTLQKSYTAIQRVLLTLQDDGGSAIGAKAMDKDEVNGPQIKCFDAGGAATTGRVDATVKGY